MIKEFIKGFGVVFSHLYKPAITKGYPEKIPELNSRFRGKHKIENCSGCGYCQKVCPSDAITIKKNNNIVEKYVIDYSKCIFCGNCIYYCPINAIKSTDVFEFVTNKKTDLLKDLLQEYMRSI